MKTRLVRFLWMAGLAAGCGGSQAGGPGAPPPDPTETPPACLASLWVPGDFDFAMTREVEVEVVVRDVAGLPFPGVAVAVYDAVSEMPGLQTQLGAGVTDPDGRAVITVVLPSDQAAVRVVASFMGGRNAEVVPVQDGRASIALGGEQP